MPVGKKGGSNVPFWCGEVCYASPLGLTSTYRKLPLGFVAASSRHNCPCLEDGRADSRWNCLKGKRDLHPKSLVKYDFDVMTELSNYLKAAALQTFNDLMTGVQWLLMRENQKSYGAGCVFFTGTSVGEDEEGLVLFRTVHALLCKKFNCRCIPVFGKNVPKVSHC